MKSTYGICLEEQDETLNQLRNLCLSVRVIGKSGLLLFQSELVIAIRSFQGLYIDWQFKGYRHLMSAKCNQDVLASYFSQIRGLGGLYDHPLPAAESQRIQYLLMCRNTTVIIPTKNCSYEDFIVTRHLTPLEPKISRSSIDRRGKMCIHNWHTV